MNKTECGQKIWAVGALGGFYLALYYGSWQVGLICQILLFHAGHEAIHNALFRRRIMNKLYGTFSYSALLHNFEILRSAHLEHHSCGRENKSHCLLDHRYTQYNFVRYIEYYASLFGINYIFYMIAGFLKFISPALFERELSFLKVKNDALLRAQIIVFLHCFLVGFFLGASALYMIVIFSIYWGLSQNVAHYALPVGGNNAKYASRSFQVGRFWEFIFFGAVFRHVEHHVLPGVPGFNLNSEGVKTKVSKRLEGTPIVSYGFSTYLKALFAQLKGPKPLFEEWKHE